MIYFKKSIDSLSNCFTLAKVIFEMKTWNHQSGLGFRDTKTATLKCFTPRQWKFLLNEGMNYCTMSKDVETRALTHYEFRTL